MKIEMNGRVFFIYQFPTADRTLVFNSTDNDWSEWGKYYSFRGAYEMWVGGAYCYPEPWGKHIIGRRDKLVFAELSQSYTSDDGDLIRPARVTGHISYGTLKEKRSNEFRIRCRRGDGVGTSVGTLMVRFRDNNRSWSQPRTISLGALGETDIVARLFRTGIFRTRQYEFASSDAISIVFTAAEEDIEVLR